MNAKKKAQTQTLDGGITRRKLLKTTAGASAATAGLGAGAGSELPELVGDAEGLALTTGVIAGGVAFGAGVAIGNALEGGDAELEDTNNMEDRIYNSAASVASQVNFDDMRQNFIDPPTKEAPLYRSAWGDAEVEAARVVLSGGTDAKAWTAWKNAVDRHFQRIRFNMIQAYNQIWLGDESSSGLLAPLILNETVNNDQITFGSSGSTEQFEKKSSSYASSDGWDQVEASETYSSWPPSSGSCDTSKIDGFTCPSSGKYTLFKFETTPSKDSDPFGRIRDDIKDRTGDKTVEIYGPSIDNSVTPLVMPIASGYVGSAPKPWTQLNTFVYSPTDDPIRVTHPNLSTVDIIPTDIIGAAATTNGNGSVADNLSAIYSALTNTGTDAKNYLDNVLAPGLRSGEITESEVFSSEDLIAQYTTDDTEESQVAAAAAAVGAALPEDVGTQVKINHAKLESKGLTDPNDPDTPNGLWSNTFIQWTGTAQGKQSKTITDGSVITSSEYNAAYTVVTLADGSTKTMVLPGDSGLEILESEGGDSTTWEDQAPNPLDGNASLTPQELRDRLTQMGKTDDNIQDKMNNGGSLGGLLGGVSDFFDSAGRLALLVGGGIAGLLALNAVGGDGGGGTTVVDRGGD
jgi:hypothetical protein